MPSAPTPKAEGPSTPRTARPESADTDTLLKTHGIGLTGGIATGKSTVAQMIAKAGTPVFDADQLARAAIAPGSAGHRAVTARFPEILGDDGVIDRKKLGAIVFADKKAKDWLEATLHPIIASLLARALDEAGLVDAPKLWFYEAALLFETGRAKDFRKIWTTTCPEPVQLARIKNRNPETFKALQKAIAAQMPSAEKARRSQVVIDTDKPMAELEAEVLALLKAEQALIPSRPSC